MKKYQQAVDFKSSDQNGLLSVQNIKSNKFLFFFISNLKGKFIVRDNVLLPQQKNAHLPRGVLYHHKAAHSKMHGLQGGSEKH